MRHLHSIPARAAAPCLAALLALLSISPARAQADPTRPPAAWLAAQPRVPGVEAPAEARAPDVQIMVTGPSRTFAIVDGEPLRPGESHNGAKLLGVEPGGVVWQKDGARERSTMSPGVEKMPAGSREPLPRSSQVQKRVLNGGNP